MTLLVHVPSNRLAERHYVLDVVLREWLGFDVQVIVEDRSSVLIRLADDPFPRELLIADVLLASPPGSWLTMSSLPTTPLQHVNPSGLDSLASRVDRTSGGSLPVLYGEPARDGRAWIETERGLATPVDIFGGIFFLLVRYEEVACDAEDSHGRFPYRASLAAAEGFVGRAIADEYTELVWAGLLRVWPQLERSRHSYRVSLTHDVDHAWAALGQPPGTVARAVLGDLLRRRDLGLAAMRVRSVLSARRGIVDHDPYNTYDLLMDISEDHGLRSTFYFMAEANGEHAGRYRLSDPPLSRLLRRIHERGHEIGLHASYASHKSMEQTQREFDEIKTVCATNGIEQSAWGSRQHFLRFKAPETWRILEAVGIAHDSTVGFAEIAGFRSGTCREHRVFDAEQGRHLSLRERPLSIMDATLLWYMGLSPAEAISEAGRVADECRRLRGDAVILYHNSTLVGKNLRRHYRDLVTRVSNRANQSVAGNVR